MSYFPLTFWWWGAGTGGTSERSTAAPAGGLLMPPPPLRYDPEVFRDMQLALEQQAEQLHRRTGDMDQPYGLTVRERTIYPWKTFDANDATPSVASGRNFRTANTTSTTVTNFDGGVDGQEITVRVDDALTVFNFSGSSLVGNAGSDYIAFNGDQIKATYDAAEGVWYCQVIGV